MTTLPGALQPNQKSLQPVTSPTATVIIPPTLSVTPVEAPSSPRTSPNNSKKPCGFQDTSKLGVHPGKNNKTKLGSWKSAPWSDHDPEPSEEGFGANASGQTATSQNTQSSSQSSVVLGITKDIEETLQYLQPGVSAKAPMRRETVMEMAMPPENSSKVVMLKWQIRRMLASQRFDWAMGIIIFINSVTIGVQMTYEVEGRDITVFNFLEHFYLLTYVSELSLRFFAMGPQCLRSNWVRFDLALVGMGVSSTWIIEPILTAVVSEQKESEELLAPVLVLRVLRLLRLARSVRLLVQFKTLWMLVRGLLSSAGTMFYTFMLMALILYVFACLGVELITKNRSLIEDEVVGDIVADRFSSISVTMLTLVQFVTLDDASQIYTPFIRRSPWLLGAYFMIFIIVVSISLMNLVTAVIVEGAIEQGKQDREVQKAYENQKVAALIPTIKRLFHELDTDESGALSMDELDNAPESVKHELQKIMQSDDLATLAELIDANHSGEINIDDFCHTITKTIIADEPIEFVRLKQQMQLSRRENQAVGKKMVDMADGIEKLKSGMAFLNDDVKHLSLATKARQAKSLFGFDYQYTAESQSAHEVIKYEEVVRELAELRSLSQQQKRTQEEQNRRIATVEKSTKRIEATLEQVAAHVLGRVPLPVTSDDEHDA